MKKLFVQTAEHQIRNAACPDFLEKLPDVIRKHANLDYAYQQTSAGCFLKPTFRHMPYRNSFVPEIDITVSCHEDAEVLHLTGRPVKFVRIFMAFWFGFLALMEVFLLIAAVNSTLSNMFSVLIPIGMGVFGYLLCKLATKATFHAVMNAVKSV